MDVSCQENISIKMIIDDLPDIEYRAVMTDHPISGSPLPFFDSNHTSQAGTYAAGHPLLSGEIFVKYREGINGFLNKGGMFGWGIVPATCALMNPDGFDTVESAYDSLKKLSRLLQTKYLQSSS